MGKALAGSYNRFVVYGTFKISSLLMKKPLIGTLSGAENEFITVDAVDYLAEDFWREKDFTYSTADRGKYLGCATNGENTMRVFTVKGDPEKRFCMCCGIGKEDFI